MLAKCSRCSQTFQTDRYGEQFCPFCGAAVMIAQPGAPTSSSAPTEPGGPAPAGDQPAPVDVPEQFGGWFNAALETWKKAALDPLNFFGRVRAGPDAGGAVGYAVAIVATAAFLQALVNVLMWPLQQAQFKAFMPMLGKAYPPEAMEKLMHLSRPGFLGVFVGPVAAVVVLFVVVALVHLALMIVGGNKAGFTGTMRAICLSRGPEIFGFIPFVGPYVSFFWTLILGVIAVSGVHKITAGRAVAAYAVLFFGLCCLCCVPAVGLMSWVIGQAAQHGGGAPFNVP